MYSVDKIWGKYKRKKYQEEYKFRDLHSEGEDILVFQHSTLIHIEATKSMSFNLKVSLLPIPHHLWKNIFPIGFIGLAKILVTFLSLIKFWEIVDLLILLLWISRIRRV